MLWEVVEETEWFTHFKCSECGFVYPCPKYEAGPPVVCPKCKKSSEFPEEEVKQDE